MRISCPQCQRSLNLPDEKIPQDQVFSVTCPGCDAKVRVDPRKAFEKSPEPGHKPEPAPETPAPPAKGQENQVDEADDEMEKEAADSPSQEAASEDDDEELIFYEEDDKIALVLDKKNEDAWIRALEEKGYKIETAPGPSDAVVKMKFTHFHFVALHENFSNIPLAKNPIYKRLLETPMSVRRNMFVALVGPEYKTLNNMESFALSVNVLINEKDLGKLPAILKKVTNDHQRFYKVFKETLHAMGKQ